LLTPPRFCQAVDQQSILRPNPGSSYTKLNNKSLFASFSSEKEETCSFLKKRTKRLLLHDAGSKIRDLAGKYGVYQEDNR
jgi:hypothetical protein